MINRVWGLFIIIGIGYGFINGKVDLINQEIINSGKVALDLFLAIYPILILWVGIMAIAKESGLLNKLAKKLSPLLTFLFPEVPKGHEAYDYIASNVIVNLFGLGSAATPFGLKAMASLQKLNPKRDVASRSMITFLVMNTSGLSVIPTTIISLRMLHGSSEPTGVILPIVLATTASTVFGLFVDRILAKWRG